MFIGRKEEKKQLETAYLSEHNNLLMVYGREGIGKTALVLEFCEGREFLYYNAIETTREMQKERFSGILEQLKELDGDTKSVLVVDCFSYFSDDELNESLLSILEDENRKIMIVLISSSVNWVENSMVETAGRLAKSMTGIIKVKELNFREIVEWFPDLPVEDCVALKAVFGGVPKYLSLCRNNRHPRENIISTLLTKGAPLENEAEFCLKLELRELAAYNAILLSLASGSYKLNDIFADTGFSRAKISVYLKNLMEMDVVEKINSASVVKSDNTQKGLYRIRDPFLRFYYAYVYPNRDLIETGRESQLYDEIIMDSFMEFQREAFADVAREFLQIMSRRNALKSQYVDYRIWVGKSGTLDIVAKDSSAHALAAMCYCGNEPASVDVVKKLNDLISDSGIDCIESWLFSQCGFTDTALYELHEGKISAVDMKDL